MLTALLTTTQAQPLCRTGIVKTLAAARLRGWRAGTCTTFGAVLAALTAVVSSPASAQPAACGAGFVLPPRPAMEASKQVGAVDIHADEASLAQDGVSVLEGNVQIRRGALQLSAQRVDYNGESQVAEARGPLQIWDKDLYLAGELAHLDLGTEVTAIDGARFMLGSARAHGHASRIEIRSDQTVTVNNASYSTCDSADPFWVLRADEINLDRLNDVGEAYHAWLELGSVPVFYSPYLTFPLSDKRKSGFLIPSARVSSSTGIKFTQPYYFNLAPDRDATLAIRGMSRRGVQVQGEYRYLESWGEGRVAGEFLPQDRKHDSSRTALKFFHAGELPHRLQSEVDLSWVSDRDYLEDLGTNLGVSSRRHLEQRGDLSYQGVGWWSRLRVQGYQTLDDTIASEDRPYERLPQLLFRSSLRERNRQLNFGGAAEFVNFSRRDGVTGTRIDLQPALTYPIRSAGVFVIPKADVRFTQYQLDNEPGGTDGSPSRLLPTFSVDSGLLFERGVELANENMTQTLEPRLHYLLVPFEGQDELPIFDTGRNSFNFSQLFRNGRFSGADRVGGANQVSLALTSRLLAASGREYLRASVGQIRYLSDRKVTLPGAARETNSASDIVGEVGLNLDRRWRLLGGMHWDPDRGRTNKQVISMRYQPDNRRVINASYRFLREENFTSEPSVEQADVSFAWPVSPVLSVVGRWNYALDERTTLESFAGLEYESCCWAIRTVFRRYLTGEDGNHDNAVFVQLELKGLAGIGNRAIDFLERNIPGYENRF